MWLGAGVQLGAGQGVETVMVVLDRNEGIEIEATPAVGVEVHRFQKVPRYVERLIGQMEIKFGWRTLRLDCRRKAH